MRRSLLAVVSLAFGCGPPGGAAIIDGPPAASYVAIERSGSAITARAFDAEPPPIALSAGTDAWILAYDATLEALHLVPGEDGALEVLADEAPAAAGWPLPEPARWWSLPDGATAAATGVGSVDGLLSSFRVARPPCPAEPRVEAVRGVPDEGEVYAAVATGGGGVVFAQEHRGGPRLFRVRPGEAAIPIEMPPYPASMRLPEPLGLSDGGRPMIAWPGTSTVAGVEGIDLFPIVDGAPGEPLRTWIAAGSESLEELAGATIAGRRTYVARDVRGGLWSLDERTLEWRHRYGLGADYRLCTHGDNTLTLTVDGPGTGLVGARGFTLYRYDLAVASLLGARPWAPHVNEACRIAWARSESGLELVAYAQEGPVSGTILSWRRGSGDWSTVPTQVQLGAAAMTIAGDQIFVTASGNLVARLEDVPTRPELPPRECGETSPGLSVRRILDVGAGFLFVSGTDHGPKLFEIGR